MVKKAVVSIFILLFTSCHKVVYNEYHIPPRISQKELLNIDEPLIIPDSIYKYIDTLTLYQKVKYKSIGSDFIPKEDSYIQFYSGGKLIS